MVALRLRHVFLTLGIAAVMLLMHVQLALPASAQTSTYQNDCGCVHFVQHYLLDHGMTPLAGGVNTASGYTEGFMRSIGYYRVKPTNDPVNNYIPADGAVMVWDAGQKGAYDAGHMAIV